MVSPEDNLAELMRRYQLGDKTAFVEFYALLASAMTRYLRTLVPASLVEDVLQDGFIRLHRVRHTYRPEAPVRPWVYTIFRYTAIDALRKRRRQQREIGVEQLDYEDKRRSATTDVAIRQMWEAIERLPASQREVLVMQRLNDLSIKEIAQTLRTSEGAVKQKLHRAYEKLRAMLDPGHHDE